MPSYDVYIEHNVSSFHVGTIDLDSQWFLLHFHALSQVNRLISFQSIYNIEHSDRDVPVSEYNISIILNRIVDDSSNRNYITLVLEDEESGCIGKYIVTGYLKDYSGVLDGKVNRLQIEAESLSIVKIIA